MTTLTLTPTYTDAGAHVTLGQTSATFSHLPDLLMWLRMQFQHHHQIVTIGGLEVVGDHPWREPVENRLAELLDDLGNCPQDSWKGALNAIRHGPMIASCPNSANLKDAHQGMPAICLASGPSAKQHMARVAELQSSHYIFACDSILDGCIANGITPDYTCVLEREQHMARLVTQGGCGTYLLAPPVIDPDCVKPFGDRVMWWWGADELYHWLGEDITRTASGRSAGTMSVAAAILAGCNPIYLVGHDLAYDGDASHSPDAHPFTIQDQKRADNETNGSQHTKRVELPRNGGGTVRSNAVLSLFKGDIETIIAMNRDRRIYNVNYKTGAAINGTITQCLPISKGLPKPPKWWQKDDVLDPRTRIPSILVDIESMKRGAKDAYLALVKADSQAEIEQIAGNLVVSKLVSPGNAWLFRYVFRSLYDAMKLRLHIREHDGITGVQPQAIAQAIVTEGLVAMCEEMRRDLTCLML